MEAFAISMPFVGCKARVFHRDVALSSRRRPRPSIPIVMVAPASGNLGAGQSSGKNGNNSNRFNDEDKDNLYSNDSSKVDRRQAEWARQNLEMGWRFQTRKNLGPTVCQKCKGRGRVECGWCHSTGVLMLGDRLICSVEGRTTCLACENGEVQCKACKGTGRLAAWMVQEV